MHVCPSQCAFLIACVVLTLGRKDHSSTLMTLILIFWCRRHWLLRTQHAYWQILIIQGRAAPGLWPLNICNPLMHSRVIHFDAQVICPCYEVATPSDVLYGAFPGVQNGVLAAEPTLHISVPRLYPVFSLQ